VVEDENYIKNLYMIKQILEYKTNNEISKIIKYISDKEASLIKNKSS